MERGRRTRGRIEVLGPLSVSIDGRPVGVGGPRSQAVLVTLAHHLDEVVSVDTLFAALWADTAPKSARNVVQVQVSGLRRALGPLVDLQTRGTGYLLSSSGLAVDVAEFEQLARSAKELLSSNPGKAVEAAVAASRLWRGSPAGNDLDIGPVRGRLESLGELRLRTLATLLDARLQLGEHHVCCEDAALLADEHPFREDFRAFHLLALYRSGRQAEALTAYRRTRDLLVEELGVEPGPHLRSLQRQILEQDPGLDLSRDETTTSPVALSSTDATLRTDNLTAEPNAFVERPEITTVLQALAPGRVVTVVGTGGIGKSRCVAAAARRCLGTAPFVDGVWLVDLAPLPDGSGAVAASVASALRLAQHPGSTATEDVIKYLRDRRSLIVLDNCEHVAVAVTAFVETVTAESATTAVLAASRVRLGIAAESVVTVNRLEDDAAQRLLAARIAEAGAGPFSDRECAELCEVLDNYPLAIELAAARTRALSPREIATRIGDQPAVLGSSVPSGAHRDAEVSSRSPGRRYADLSTALDWSLRQLSTHARDTLDRATVFVSGFDLDGAEAVLTTSRDRPGDVVASLGELVEHHLVARDHRAARFRLLEPIRQHLRNGAPVEVQDRYVGHYATFAVEAAMGLRGPDEAQWWDRLRIELPHVREVVRWATDHEDVELLDSIMGEMAFAVAVLACVEPGEWAIESLRQLQLEPADAPGLAAAAGAHLALHTLVDQCDELLDAIADTENPRMRSVIASIRVISNPSESRWGDQLEESALACGDLASLALAKMRQLAPDMIETVDALGNPTLRVFARCFLSASMESGTSDEARRNKEELYRIALTSNNTRTIAEGQGFMALQHCYDGQPGRAGPLAAEMIERMVRLRSPGLVWHGVEVIANMLAMVRVEPYASETLWSAVTNSGYSPFSRVVRDPALPPWVAAQLSDDERRRAAVEGASLDLDAAARAARKAAERMSAA